MERVAINGIKLSDAIKLKSVLVYYNMLNGILRSLAAILFRKNDNPANILIFRTGSLGDSLCAIPSISAIRKKYPLARIDILTNPGRSTLVSIDQLLSPEIYNQVINYYGLTPRQTISMLSKKKYDLVIQLPQAIHSFRQLVRDILFFRLISRSGWGWELGKIFFFRKVQEKYIKYDTEVIRLAKIAARNNIKVDLNDYPLNITSNDTLFVEDTFTELGITGKKVIGIVIGANRPQNRWPINYVKEVISYFASSYHIIIVGGKEDKELASTLCIHHGVFNLCGRLTPMQSGAAIRKCCVVLSNDTGPMHLSYAVGTPTVATFTSRDYIGTWFPPESDKNIVFRTDDVPCSICLSEFCGNNICIQAIRPSFVYKAMERLIIKTGT